MGNGPVPRYAERRISKRLLNLPLTRRAYLRAGEQSDFRIRNAAERCPRAAGPVRSGGFDLLGSDQRLTAQLLRVPTVVPPRRHRRLRGPWASLSPQEIRV